jgi:hypothetical protein
MGISGWLHVPALASLAVVAGLLGGSMLYSLVRTRQLGRREGPGAASEA